MERQRQPETRPEATLAPSAEPSSAAGASTAPAAFAPDVAAGEEVDPGAETRQDGLLTACLVGALLLLVLCVTLLLAAANRAPG